MLSINISELVLTVASFFLLLFVLKKLLFDPLISFMEDRQSRIEAGLAESRQADEQLKAAEERRQAQAEETRQKAAALVKQGIVQGERELADAETLLRQRGDEASEHSRQEAEALRKKNQAQLEAMSPELISVLAQRLLE